ncbi:uncharacterized protein [Aegilops tauschii subsp. strangulata]|uniref:uncharacterized protein n=1 Tax=Aegilops tauschii subsp. strangulata TaxID=200361 RepID=UPI001E1CA2AA|nr:translation initiation factor IF-2-like [Aegilops tauschii subsp. strangulata]
MRAATTPSRRERSSPPPVRPKIEQVFTSANIHHHRTPHPGNHGAHTAMVTGKHQDPPHPNERDERKGPTFRAPGRPPASRPNRSARTGIHRPVLLPRARDELGLAASRGGRGQSCCTVRETSSVLLHRARDELGPAAPGARRAVDRSWERTSPLMGVAPGRQGDGVKVETARTQTSRHRRSRPLPRADPSSHHEAATTPVGHHRDLPMPPPTAGAVATPGRCPTRIARRAPSAGAAGHAPPKPGAAGRPPKPDPAGSGKRPAARHLPRREHRSCPAARGTKVAGAPPPAGHPAAPRDRCRAAGSRGRPAPPLEGAAPRRRPQADGEEGPRRRRAPRALPDGARRRRRGEGREAGTKAAAAGVPPGRARARRGRGGEGRRGERGGGAGRAWEARARRPVAAGRLGRRRRRGWEP